MAISHRTHRLRLNGSPSVQKLHGGRFRLTFKLTSTNPREDWYSSNKDSIFAEYGSLQSAAFDNNGAEARTGEAYDNMLLVNASSQSEGENYGITFVYETLTSSFVAESKDKVDFDMNGLKRVVRTIIAESSSTYSNALGTTPLSDDVESLDNNVILAKSEDYQLKADEGGFRRITETYLEKGVISVDVKTKYGGNAETPANNFQIAEIKAVGLTATEALADSSLSGFSAFDTAEENKEGLSVFIYRYTKGSGEISRTTSTEGLITNTVITSINVKPNATDIGIITKTDVQAREDAIIYTYTFSAGSGTLETKTSNKYGGKLTITTVRSLGDVPSVPAGAYLVSSSSESSGAFTIHTATYASGSGEIGQSVDQRYNNKLTITTKTSLNSVPQMSATAISTSIDQGDYGQVYTYKFASGSGLIGETTQLKYNDKITVKTVKYLNTSAVPTSGNVISTDEQETDFGTISSATYYTGGGQIQNDSQNRYNNKLTITTLANINGEPTVPSGGYLMKTSVRDTEYGPITSKTYASGQGKIEDSNRSKVITNDGLSGEVTEVRERHLNPVAVPEKGTDHILTSERTTDGDFGQMVEYVWIKGTGILRQSDEVRSDGSEVHTFLVAGTTDPTTQMSGTEGNDYFLVSKDIQAQEGYEITTYKYYTLPENYTIPYAKTLRSPDLIKFDRDLGAHIDTAGSMDSYEGETNVTFSVELPETFSVDDLEPSVVVFESVGYSDGSLSDRTTVFRNAYADSSVSYTDTGSGSELYRGKPYRRLTSSFNGADEDPFTGTIVVGHEILPYLSAGGVTVYKTTKSTITVGGSSSSSGSSGFGS